jgi:hypothetical protein
MLSNSQRDTLNAIGPYGKNPEWIEEHCGGAISELLAGGYVKRREIWLIETSDGSSSSAPNPHYFHLTRKAARAIGLDPRLLR